MTEPTPRTEAGRAERDVEDALLQIVNTTLRPEQGQVIMRLVRRVRVTAEAQARTEALDVEALATMLGDWVRWRDDTCGGLVPCEHDREIAAAILAAKETPDTASDYGRLLADRDRLIGEGVDPDDLLVPEPPAKGTP